MISIRRQISIILCVLTSSTGIKVYNVFVSVHQNWRATDVINNQREVIVSALWSLVSGKPLFPGWMKLPAAAWWQPSNTLGACRCAWKYVSLWEPAAKFMTRWWRRPRSEGFPDVSVASVMYRLVDGGWFIIILFDFFGSPELNKCLLSVLFPLALSVSFRQE